MFLQGEIDLSSAGLLAEEIRRAEALRPNRVVLDCHELEFIDSSGIAVLIKAQERANEEGHLLVLTRVPRQARRVLDLTGLTDWFTLA